MRESSPTHRLFILTLSTSQVWALTKATAPSQNRLLASDSSSPTTFSSSFPPNKPLVTCPHPPSLRPISPNSLPKTIQSLASPVAPKGQNTITPLTSSQIQTTGMVSNHIPPQPHVTQKPLPPLANDRRSPPRFAVPPLIPPSPFKNNLIFKLFPSRTCSANPNHRTFNPSTATHLSGLALSLIG